MRKQRSYFQDYEHNPIKCVTIWMVSMLTITQICMIFLVSKKCSHVIPPKCVYKILHNCDA